VITGFNTDIEFAGVVYHVQTEDKGLAKPVILSLVYDRGTILASKRAPYDDLVDQGFDESLLAERLHRQHRLICAAVKAGRLDDLRSMSSREARDERSIPAIPKPPIDLASPDAATAGTTFPGLELERSIPMPVGLKLPMPVGSADEPLIDVLGVIEEVSVVPDEAVAVISDMAGRERRGNNRLSIEFLGDTNFIGGEKRSILLFVARGSARKVVPSTEVMVKIIGSDFRPVIYHATTDQNGVAKVDVKIPTFRTGRAAFLVRAINDGEEVELRRPIKHG
jgi:hypothetical protein